ncbi:MAG: glycosyltransferase [Armatimonadetes bacterium]|nr:glycosyltransferase [Armatimonadota bacterium]
MNREQANRITVAHLIGRLNIGGAEEQLVSLAPEFDAGRFRVIVCVLQPGGTLENRLEAADVKYHSFGFRLRSAPLAVLRICSFLKRERVDVLHMHMYHAALYGRIAGLLARVPVMITTDHGKGMWKKPWQVAFERYMVRHTALRIGVSQDVADIIRNRERVPDDKLIVVRNGVNAERFRAGEAERASVRTELGVTEHTFLVGTLARLVEPKALHVMIEAVSIASKDVPGIRLLIVGDGPLRAELDKCASDLGVRDGVIFTGARSDVPGLLAAMDVFALSSIREGLPISLLEAMAAGKPIVATRVGGIPDVIADREDGLLVEPDAPQAFADAICDLAADADLASRLGQRAAEKAESDYSVKATARKLEEIYARLSAGQSAAG